MHGRDRASVDRSQSEPGRVSKSEIPMISAFVYFIKGNWELMDLPEIPLYVFNRSLPEIDESPTLGGRIFVDFWEAPVENVKGNWGRVDRSRTQCLQKKIKS